MESKANRSPLPALTEVALLPKAELHVLYRRLLKADPPPRARIEFLRRNAAWALQALSQGSNPITLRKRLVNGAARATSGRSGVPYKPAPA